MTAAFWTPSSRTATAFRTASSGVAAVIANNARSLTLPDMKPDFGNRSASAALGPANSAYSSMTPLASMASTSSAPVQSRKSTGDLRAIAASIRPDPDTTFGASCSPSRCTASVSTAPAGAYSFSITTGCARRWTIRTSGCLWLPRKAPLLSPSAFQRGVIRSSAVAMRPLS